MLKVVEKYKAVADETRLRILRALIESGRGLYVCELADILEKPQYAVSRSLCVLRGAGMVREKREGKLMRYAVDDTEASNRLVLESIKSVCRQDPLFSTDLDRMKERMELRVEDKCVVGCRKKEGPEGIHAAVARIHRGKPRPAAGG